MSSENVMFDHESVTTWLQLLFRDTPGLRSIVGIDQAGRPTWREFAADQIDEAADYVEHLDGQRVPGIYLRCTTLDQRPGRRGRGGSEHSVALPGLWADVDIAGPGHKHDPSRHDGRDLPADEAAARAIVVESGLPEPTLWVHSGGGMYPWWLIDRPYPVVGDGGAAADMSERWQHVLGAAATRIGMHYGTGVGDLARILRVPGSVNRKAGLERPCRIVETTGRVHSFDELLVALNAAEDTCPVATPPFRATPTRTASATPRSGRPPDGPFDVLAAIASWADVFEPAGWVFVGAESDGAQRWKRPGATSAYSARCGHSGVPVAVVWSDAAGLPSGPGQRLTIGRVYAWLFYGGDERAAARDLVGGAPIGLPGSVAAAVHERFRDRPRVLATSPPSPTTRREPRPVGFRPGIGDLDPVVAAALDIGLARRAEANR